MRLRLRLDRIAAGILVAVMSPAARPQSPEGGAAKKVAAVPTREEIDERYKWDLSGIFADTAAWEADYARAEKAIDKLAGLKGSAAKSGKTLLELLQTRDQASVQVDKIALYASLLHDQDTKDNAAQELNTRANTLADKFKKATAWLEPELVALPSAQIDAWLAADPKLAVYRHYFEDLLRQREHVLSPREEELLAMSGELSRAPQNIYQLLANADMKFPTIEGAEGESIELSEARYRELLNHRDRRLRRDAFKGVIQTYAQYSNTCAATLAANVQRNIFMARARHYDSALEASLNPDNVSVEVYKNLVATIGRNLPALHRYAALRKKVLKLDDLRLYDLYVPLVSEADFKVPYDDAVKTILSALQPLGDDYLTNMRKGFTSRWADVQPTRNKRSGAYCNGTYLVHPYLLLNYDGTYDGVSTVAHEMGHAMHTHYTQTTQPIIYGDYPIFLAEVASTSNEIILNRYVREHETDPKRKAYLLNQLIEQIRNTVFTQTMFAEFELAIHEMAERDQPLTAKALNDAYAELLHKYYGDVLAVDPEAPSIWIRIPHFYYNFYVYKYATSYAAATALARNLSEGKPDAQSKLLGFLKAGRSDYPIDILKRAGVDMSTPAPIEDCMKLFSELLEQFEALQGSS